MIFYDVLCIKCILDFLLSERTSVVSQKKTNIDRYVALKAMCGMMGMEISGRVMLRASSLLTTGQEILKHAIQ